MQFSLSRYRRRSLESVGSLLQSIGPNQCVINIVGHYLFFLVTKIFLPNCVVQFKNSISFSSSADLLYFIFPDQFFRLLIPHFVFFTLFTIRAAFSTDPVYTGSSERLVGFKKEDSFRSSVGEGKFSEKSSQWVKALM